MTSAYTPTWHDTAQDYDLCDITITVDGHRMYCQRQAVHAGVDTDGGFRLLCAEHVAALFPASS